MKGTKPLVTVRYWAAARAGAGIASEELAAETLAEVLMLVKHRHDDPAFARLVDHCSILLDEVPVRSGDATQIVLPAGATVDLLPPFAGG